MNKPPETSQKFIILEAEGGIVPTLRQSARVTPNQLSTLKDTPGYFLDTESLTSLQSEANLPVSDSITYRITIQNESESEQFQISESVLNEEQLNFIDQVFYRDDTETHEDDSAR